MASVHDVAAYILEQRGQMSAMKLQKLVYYSQAWSLVWDDEPLFLEEIQAWANGPVVYELYDRHRGAFSVRDWPSGDSRKLEQRQRETIDAVLLAYAKFEPHELSELTHLEEPWKIARGRLLPGERGESVITHASMRDYYSKL